MRSPGSGRGQTEVVRVGPTPQQDLQPAVRLSVYAPEWPSVPTHAEDHHQPTRFSPFTLKCCTATEQTVHPRDISIFILRCTRFQQSCPWHSKILPGHPNVSVKATLPVICMTSPRPFTGTGNQPKRNSLSRSSLMLSRSRAAFSNSNFLAASRISASSLVM